MLTLTLSVVMKVFLFASFKVPTGSMEPTIVPGDFVFVNKLLTGPRVYRDFGFLKGKKTPYKRIRGMRQIRRNDILVFDALYLISGILKQIPNQFYVKRCIAVPGDTFLIENGKWRIENDPDSAGYAFRQQELSQMSKDDFSDMIWQCFPFDTVHCHWNIKDFGPLYIPGKGDRLELNQQNIALYEPLIQYETEKRITVREDQLFLGDEPLFSYTFTHNYYFMAGDYVVDSHDSRYWGLLPEDFVVGTAVLIWKSEDPLTGKFRWNRFLT
jgi:signal peptidase I